METNSFRDFWAVGTTGLIINFQRLVRGEAGFSLRQTPLSYTLFLNFDGVFDNDGRLNSSI
ncbi:hypothetical protein Scep_026794 [Stephania cephalantha]|uniref:Uncharacterized protein n=1 Tax=Stephania cephalantha TaxID=152367 RepID=A0AAP0HTM3_9MAGN